ATESFTVTLSGASGATISVAQGTGTITNDDAAPSFSITPSVSHPEGNGGTTAFDFTVTESGATEVTATVDYATANGTATAGTGGSGDYTAAGATLTFLAGETTKTITVLVNGDTV